MNHDVATKITPARKRIAWIDCAKGLGIIMVVLYHAMIPSLRNADSVCGHVYMTIYQFLATIIMPLFFFALGYLFELSLPRYKSKIQFIKNKARYLLIPYLSYSVFNYIVILIALQIPAMEKVFSQSSGGYEQVSFGRAVFQILTGEGNMDKHIWFVAALFIAFTLNILWPRALKHPVSIIIFFIIKCCLMFLGFLPEILYYLARNMLYFQLARLISDTTFMKMKRTAAYYSILLFLITNVLLALGITFGVNKINAAVSFGFYCLSAVIAVLGCISICNLCRFFNAAVTRVISYPGRHSYEIYLMHAPYLVNGLIAVLLAFTAVPSFVACLVGIVAGIFIPMLLAKYFLRKIGVLRLLFLGEKLRKTPDQKEV